MRNIEEYDRVTTVLSPFSGLNLVNPQILANAASRGSVVHKICDFMVSNIGIFDEEMDDLVWSYAQGEEHFEKEKMLVKMLSDSFLRWLDGKKLLKKPSRFFNDTFKITGECDMLYESPSKGIVLVDIKTSSNESKTWELQGSAYSKMANESGLRVNAIEFVKLSRTGSKPKEIEYQENFGLFISALDTYRHFYKNVASPTNEDYL